ncbi:MAG: hypothetical protein V4479_14815 [Actinomycetota bacterium]
MSEPLTSNSGPAAPQRIDPADIELVHTQPIEVPLFVAGPTGIELVLPA